MSRLGEAIAQIVKERNKLKEENERLEAIVRNPRCAFCGAGVVGFTPHNANEKMAEHIAGCTKHPLHQAIRTLRYLNERANSILVNCLHGPIASRDFAKEVAQLTEVKKAS